MLEFIKTYISELLAVLAIIASLVANSRAHSANKRAKLLESKAEHEKHLARRTELILESERNNALVGKLALIAAKKALLLREAPELVEDSQTEIERLKNNIELFQSLKSSSDEDALLKSDFTGGHINTYHATFESIKKLSISLESEFEKELYEYEELVSKNNNHHA